MLAVLYFREKPAKLPAIQFSVYPPKGVRFGHVRYAGPPLISPDGSQLAFGGVNQDGKSHIYGAVAGFTHGQASTGTETAYVSVLVARQPLDGFLCGPEKCTKSPD